jgi:hypothetical protein
MKVFKLLFLVFFLGFISCKTCIECECSKNGEKTIEEDCVYTNDKSGAARDFTNHLKNNKGYDECFCTY